MEQKNSKKDYYKLIDELKTIAAERPKEAQAEAYYSLQQMGKIKFEGYNKFLYNLPLIFAIFIFIMNVITCFNNPTQIPFGLFGLIFFFAGYFIGMNESGLLFLFSHGFTGFCVMNGLSVYSIVKNPIITDSPTLIIILLVVALLLVISSLIYGTIYSFSDNLKINPINKSIPLALAGLSTVVIQSLAIYLGF